jgi:hypothetical protein
VYSCLTCLCEEYIQRARTKKKQEKQRIKEQRVVFIYICTYIYLSFKVYSLENKQKKKRACVM